MFGQPSVGRSQSASRYFALAPSFAVSLTVTELFFKFGSFSLELVGFAALWGGLYGIQAFVTKALKKE